MPKNNKIKLSLPYSKDQPDKVMNYVRCAMAEYPDEIKNLDATKLLDATPDNQKILDRIGAFRSEINFFCRDNLQEHYRIEDVFEPEGLRVYFVDANDYEYFVKKNKTVSPPDLPEVIRNQFL
jgi:hypothetical protein